MPIPRNSKQRGVIVSGSSLFSMGGRAQEKPKKLEDPRQVYH